jgi:energy-coupling factor transporter ATP-binding protein EcfA2
MTGKIADKLVAGEVSAQSARPATGGAFIALSYATWNVAGARFLASIGKRDADRVVYAVAENRASRSLILGDRDVFTGGDCRAGCDSAITSTIVAGLREYGSCRLGSRADGFCGPRSVARFFAPFSFAFRLKSLRLTQIKLSGFKSFVDPTAIATPGQLVGIVGPNGCGKSNVIDAVRWVLGESKASALRGESMQDVIFNGAGERKPIGRASVELVFDNSEGRIGGQWGQYAELSIKRLLARDADSNYYINNIPVRRRDIYDLFLGTGLGPRAYAIIEQGMISRVVEAKPEELRIFLEEAAGVSKYRERRKETEGRLSDTRENLARVEDIRLELGNQLARLEQQAKVATDYRELEGRLKQSQQMQWLAKKAGGGTRRRTRDRRDRRIDDCPRCLAGGRARGGSEPRIAARRALRRRRRVA